MSGSLRVESANHLGIEATPDHDQEQTLIGLPGVQPDHGPLDNPVGDLTRRRGLFDFKELGQQIFRAERQNGQGRFGGEQVGQQGDRAVTTGGNHAPESVLPLAALHGLPQFVQRGELRCLQPLALEGPDQLGHDRLIVTGPRLGVSRDKNLPCFLQTRFELRWRKRLPSPLSRLDHSPKLSSCAWGAMAPGAEVTSPLLPIKPVEPTVTWTCRSSGTWACRSTGPFAEQAVTC